ILWPDTIRNRRIPLLRSYFQIFSALRKPDINLAETAVVTIVSGLVGNQVLRTKFFGNLGECSLQRKHIAREKRYSTSFFSQRLQRAVLLVLHVPSFNSGNGSDESRLGRDREDCGFGALGNTDGIANVGAAVGILSVGNNNQHSSS